MYPTYLLEHRELCTGTTSYPTTIASNIQVFVSRHLWRSILNRFPLNWIVTLARREIHRYRILLLPLGRAVVHAFGSFRFRSEKHQTESRLSDHYKLQIMAVPMILGVGLLM